MQIVVGKVLVKFPYFLMSDVELLQKNIITNKKGLYTARKRVNVLSRFGAGTTA